MIQREKQSWIVTSPELEPSLETEPAGEPNSKLGLRQLTTGNGNLGQPKRYRFTKRFEVERLHSLQTKKERIARGTFEPELRGRYFEFLAQLTNAPTTETS